MMTGLFLSSALADGKKEMNKTFNAKESLYVKAVSSNCDIEKGTENKIIVKIVYTYDDDCYTVEFNESASQLEIREDFSGMCKGESHISIKVPENIYVSFNSASGDFSLTGTKKGAKVNVASGDVKIEAITGDVHLNSASGDMQVNSLQGNLSLNTASGNLVANDVKGNVEVETASGDMTLTNISDGLDISAASGDIEAENVTGNVEIVVASGDIMIKKLNGSGKIKAASGNITITEAKGKYEMKTASGNIETSNIQFTGASELMAASGNVNVSLNSVLNSDLELTTASGDAILDFNGNEIKGYVEMSAREDKGKIVSDIKFDKEEKEERNGKTYDVKSFSRNGNAPKIFIQTASGTAELRK